MFVFRITADTPIPVLRRVVRSTYYRQVMACVLGAAALWFSVFQWSTPRLSNWAIFTITMNLITVGCSASLFVICAELRRTVRLLIWQREQMK